ncbi:MAG: hypothetical protein CVV10_08655 [Gammaproteobacteria bacterium HGW-Gammaproteobacteria-14]|nr:MAG: hypothetical protein CVV10_08655 [Gammaproteobacteria bacterium HGW-Gammaproteobacteria-14]
MPVITAFYTALLLLLMLALAINVVRWRLKAKVSFGDGGNRDLNAAIRAHGNASEHIPLVVIGLALLEMHGASALAIHGYGATFVLARVIHPLGLMRPRAVNRVRQLGVVLTWLVMLGLAAHLLVRII